MVAYLGERPSFTFAVRDTAGTVAADTTVLDLRRTVVEPESVPSGLALADPSNILRFLKVFGEARALDWSFSTNLRFFTDPVAESRSAALRLTVDVPFTTLFCLSVACSFFQLLENFVASIARSESVCKRYCMPRRR